MTVAQDSILFGLRLRSEFPLPELAAVAPGSEPDIMVIHGEVTLPRKVAGWQPCDDGGAVLTIDGVARYAVHDGARIIVQAEPGAAERNVRLFLLGSAMGMLLHQRGLLPLHANAVEIDGQAVAFMGRSGAGKSTLAAWFHERGHRVISDDVCVVAFDPEGRPLATPGLPRLRLWGAALESLGKDRADFQRSFAGEDDYDKYDVPLSLAGAADAAIPLAAVYLLERGDAFRVDCLAGVAAADAIFANTYRGELVRLAKGPRDHWDACLRLISRTAVLRVERPWELARMDEQNEAILAHAKHLLASPRAV